MPRPGLLIIGLGGATCGGKSTLAELLCKLFSDKAKKLNQDDFYHSENFSGHKFLPEFNHINWELESAFNNKKLVDKVQDWIKESENSRENPEDTVLSRLLKVIEDSPDQLLTENQPSKYCRELFQDCDFLPKLLVVEGIHVLTHPPLVDLLDLKVFVSLDYDTCKSRRLKRSYDPPDPPNYFEGVVWPSYLDQAEVVSKDKSVVQFDGKDQTSHNFSKLLQSILRKTISNPE